MATTPSPATEMQESNSNIRNFQRMVAQEILWLLWEGFDPAKQLRTHMSGKTRRSDCEKDTIPMYLTTLHLSGSFESFWLVAGYRKSVGHPEYGPKMSCQISPFFARNLAICKADLHFQCASMMLTWTLRITVPLLDIELSFQSAFGSVDTF